MPKITIYIALLRGINVGGHKLIRMQELKSLLTNMGLDKVRNLYSKWKCYISFERNAEQLEEQMEQEIRRAFGFSVIIILRTASELEQIISSCPYPVNSVIRRGGVYIYLC